MTMGNKILLKFLWLPVCMLCISTNGAFGQDQQGLLVNLNGQELTSMQDQNASSQKLMKIIHLEEGQKALREVLQDIANQAGLKLSYSKQLIPLNKEVTIKQATVTARQALWKVLEGTSLRFGVSHSGQLFFFEKQEDTPPIKQEIVTGTVSDVSTGETLPGVNVVVKGTSTGTATNAEGEFDLMVESLQDTLVFSFVGYERQLVPLNGQNKIDIKLKTLAFQADELVVIGYGTQERRDVTGSVSSISSRDFNSGIQNSPEQLIQGKVAGVQISQTSGEPGGGMSIQIRGIGSINAGTSPLYVIDGVPIDNSPMLSQAGGAGTAPVPNPRNPLNSLNMNDIESIEVLKDASATAIYGSRAANGVVLITTKDGNEGRVNVDYGLKIGRQSASKKMDLLSTQEYMDVINGISQDKGYGIVFTDQNSSNIGKGTDWQDEVFQSAAIMTDNTLSISGGTQNNTYLVSLNHLFQDGIVKNTGLESYNIRTNLNFKIHDKIDFSLKLNAANVKNDNSVDGRGSNESSGPINSALGYDPTEPIYNEDGSFARSSFLTINNPVSVLEGVISENVIKRFLGNASVGYDVTEQFSMNLQIGMDLQSDRRDLFNTTKTIRGASFGGLAGISTLNRENFVLEYTSSYENIINEINEITLLGGVSFQHFIANRFNGGISDFPTDNIRTYRLGLGDISTVHINSNKLESKLMSYFGRLNYKLLDRYLLTATLRADGSSKFGENERFGLFPSMALAWNMVEEEFMPSIFTEFKPRLSWGITGNQDIGNNQTELTLVSSKDVIFEGQRYGSLRPARIANPDLKWERTEQFNVGLDASILNDRITTSVDYFVKNTNDMLINIPLPRSSGFASKLTNLENAEVQNKGLEILVNSINASRQNFSWSSSISFSTIQNKVTNLGGAARIIMRNSALIDEGESIGSYFGHRVLGIFQESDDIANSAQPDAQPGFPIIDDINRDGIIDDNDRVILGDPFPDFIYGIQNTISYSRFQFRFFIEGKQGVDILNMNAIDSIYPQNFRRNRFREHGLNRWTPENTDTKFPSGTFPSAYDGNKVNSLTVQDASYIRLKNFSLSYDIPQNIIRNASVSLTGQNLITITDYSGFNPEANLFGSSIVHADYNAYPLARTITLGINLGF